MIYDQEELIARLLAAQQFPPPETGDFEPGNVSDSLEIEVHTASLLLEEMCSRGFVRALDYARPKADMCRYHITWDGWRERERLLRAQGKRFPALLRARDYPLDDLLIALLMSGHIENQNMPGNFWGAETKKTISELCIYLTDYSEKEILDACQRLCEQRLAVEAQLHVGPIEKAFDCTQRSKRAYDSRIAGSLGLRPNQSILDLRNNRLLLDLPTPPWHQPSMQNLESVLVKAYSTVRGTKILAQYAGINIERWNEQQAPAHAWHELLELAMAQRLLRNLIEQALRDPSVNAYHDELRKFLALRVSDTESPN